MNHSASNAGCRRCDIVGVATMIMAASMAAAKAKVPVVSTRTLAKCASK